MIRDKTFLLVMVMFLGVPLIQTSQAATTTYNWTGSIADVFIDTGEGSYTGTQIGDTFSGSFTYDPNFSNITGFDTSDGNPSIDPTDVWVEYFLGSSSATMTNGTTQHSANSATLSINNNDPIAPDDLDFAESLLGTPVAPGSLVDAWGLDFSSSNIEVEISYGSLLPIYNDLSFRALAPWSPPGSPSDPNNQFAIFEIIEFAGYGPDGPVGEWFLAYGFLTGSPVPSPVPIPAAVWLFGTALIGLVGSSKRRKASWHA